MQWDIDNGRRRHKICRSDSDVSISSDGLLFSAEDDPGLFVFEDSDPDDQGGLYSSLEVDNFYSEVGLPGSQDTDQESAFKQSRNIPFLTQRKKGTSKEALKWSTSIPLDEFEDGAQRWAAKTLITAVRHFFDTVEEPESVQDVAKWIFSKSHDPASFNNCCIVNQARPDVLRMRIQYELWRKGISAKEPLPITQDEVPDYLTKRAFFTTGMTGVSVVHMLWRHPGIGNTKLMEMLNDRQRLALSAMADQYIVAPIETEPYRWYATGINPILQSLDQADTTGSVSYRIERRRKLEMSWASRFENF